MNSVNAISSKILSTSSSAFGAYATNLLFEEHPEIQAQFGAQAFDRWKKYFGQRIRELSVAVEESEPGLFVSQIRWDRTAFSTREVSENVLVAALNCLKKTLLEELPDHCSKTPSSYLENAIAAFKSLEEEKASIEEKDEMSRLAALYLLNIMEGNSQTASKLVIDEYENGLPILDAYSVLMQAQIEVGMMWHRSEISIAEEHLVTNTTRRTMSVLAYLADRKPANNLTVVSGAVAENNHDIGVRAVSDFFEFDGWRAVCTGGDNPPEEIAQAVRCFDASLVLISAALTTHLRATKNSIQCVRELSPECKIMVGGEAFRETPDLWKQLGADGYAKSPADALELGKQLCSVT